MVEKFAFQGVGVEESDVVEDKLGEIELELEEIRKNRDKLQAQLGIEAYQKGSTAELHNKIENLNRRKRELESEKAFIEERVLPSVKEEENEATKLKEELREKDKALFEAVNSEDWEEALNLADDIARILNEISEFLPKGDLIELDHGNSYSSLDSSYDKFKGENRLGYWGELNDVDVPVDFSQEDFSDFNNSVRHDLYNRYTAKWLIFFGVKSDKKEIKDLKRDNWPYPLTGDDKEKIEKWKRSDRSAKLKVKGKFLQDEPLTPSSDS